MALFLFLVYTLNITRMTIVLDAKTKDCNFPTVENILSEFEGVDKNVPQDKKFFKSRLRLITVGEMNGAEELYDLYKYKEAPFVFSKV